MKIDVENPQAVLEDFLTRMNKGEIVERKKGKWYFRDTTRYGILPYICTVCGREANDVYDFCPNCGADMREEKADEAN